jgi:hypothetical protein
MCDIYYTAETVVVVWETESRRGRTDVSEEFSLSGDCSG